MAVSKQNRTLGSSSGRDPVQNFGKEVVERYGWGWFECQREIKYMDDEFQNEVRLQSQFPNIYQTIDDLDLMFIFETLGDHDFN